MLIRNQISQGECLSGTTHCHYYQNVPVRVVLILQCLFGIHIRSCCQFYRRVCSVCAEEQVSPHTVKLSWAHLCDYHSSVQQHRQTALLTLSSLWCDHLNCEVCLCSGVCVSIKPTCRPLSAWLTLRKSIWHVTCTDWDSHEQVHPSAAATRSTFQPCYTAVWMFPITRVGFSRVTEIKKDTAVAHMRVLA